MGMYEPMAPLQGLQNRTIQLVISRLARLPLASFDVKTMRESTTYKNMHVRPLPGSVPCEMDNCQSGGLLLACRMSLDCSSFSIFQ